jgi:hypothetical protein
MIERVRGFIGGERGSGIAPIYTTVILGQRADTGTQPLSSLTGTGDYAGHTTAEFDLDRRPHRSAAALSAACLSLPDHQTCLSPTVCRFGRRQKVAMRGAINSSAARFCVSSSDA